MVVKTPVDSTTISAPTLPHGILLGSRSWNTWIFFPVISHREMNNYILQLLSSVNLRWACVQNKLTVNYQCTILSLDITFVSAMSWVVFEHVDHVIQSNEGIIDSNNLDKYQDNETITPFETISINSTTVTLLYIFLNADAYINSLLKGSTKDETSNTSESVNSDLRHDDCVARE